MIESSHRIRMSAVIATVSLAIGLVGCGPAGGNGSNDAVKDADENISYADDTDLAFSNNKILLFSVSGSDKGEVEEALGKYGSVDASNADAGMYIVSVDGHLGTSELSDMIDDIVEKEPLIEAGSINWNLPDQPQGAAPSDEPAMPSVTPGKGSDKDD